MVNCPSTTAGVVSGFKVVQSAAAPRLAVDRKVSPDAVAGRLKTRFGPEATSLSGGAGESEILNTVPFVELPPAPVVP